MGRSADTVWVGFDLGGTKMLAVVFDDQLRAIGRRRRKTKGHEGAKAGIGRIVDTIRRCLEEAEVAPARLGGIGVGVPAPVELDTGVIVEAVNLGWKDVPLRDQLQEAFNCPVTVLNDVDAGVYGENRFGAARNARCVLGVFPGTGIGGGCVYEGEIIRGKTMSAMEIGHMQVTPFGQLCGCGRYGCLEAEASRLAIAGAVAKAAYRGQAPNLMRLVGTDLSKIRSGVLAEAVVAGDQVVEQIVRKAAGYLGQAIGSIVNLLAPDVVVLGGGLVEAMPVLMVEAVQTSARLAAMPSFVDSFTVVPAELGDDAAVMGAAAWAAKVFGGTSP